MSAPSPYRTASLLLALAACASGAAGPRSAATPAAPAATADAGAPPRRAPTTPSRAVNPETQRLFAEAVAAGDEAKKLKVPTDWEALERRWRAVVDADPLPEAWFNLGVVLEHRRRPAEARAAYQKALALEPALAPAAVNLAALDEPADPRAAAQVWSELMRRFPGDAVAPARLAALELAQGELDDASRLAREALVRDPRAVAAYKVMVQVALQRRNTGLADLLVVKARKIDPADPELATLAGDVALQQQDEPGAIAQWRQALALRDDWLPARRALLATALRHQRWEAVVEHASALLKSDPGDARVHLALGVAYRYLGQPDKALAAYAEADRAAGGKLAEVHLARGVAYMKAKDQCEPALEELDRYLAAAGPAAAADGPASRLQRECLAIVAANRQAEEAAREMKAQAERDAAAKQPTGGSSPPAQGAAPAAPGGDAAPAPRGGDASPPRTAATTSDVHGEVPTR